MEVVADDLLPMLLTFHTLTEFLHEFKIGSVSSTTRTDSVWKEDDDAPERVDPDFGPMTFDGLDSGIWQTDGEIDVPEHGARYCFSAIPGDPTGP